MSFFSLQLAASLPFAKKSGLTIETNKVNHIYNELAGQLKCREWIASYLSTDKIRASFSFIHKLSLIQFSLATSAADRY